MKIKQALEIILLGSVFASHFMVTWVFIQLSIWGEARAIEPNKLVLGFELSWAIIIFIALFFYMKNRLNQMVLDNQRKINQELLMNKLEANI